MRRKPELMQFEIGMSTSRYLPASGTAGLERSFVNGNSRVPWPPPMMTQRTVLVFSDWRPIRDIANYRLNYTVVHHARASNGFCGHESTGWGECPREPNAKKLILKLARQ